MFTLPQIEYSYDALEPVIDAKTMEIHHTKHHQAYVDKLNAALDGYEDLATETIEGLMQKINDVPMEINEAVRNNGGGHFNHTLFWEVIKPGGKKEPTNSLAESIVENFGDLEKFKAEFSAAAMNRFGSGWAWLALENDKLHICSTQNQDNPWMKGNVPILGLDVWEHAYYLKYQNKRADYVEAWWQIVNWDEVGRRYKEAIAFANE